MEKTSIDSSLTQICTLSLSKDTHRDKKATVWVAVGGSMIVIAFMRLIHCVKCTIFSNTYVNKLGSGMPASEVPLAMPGAKQILQKLRSSSSWLNLTYQDRE